MSKHLPVPPELEHLIEKRERETDRRGQTPDGPKAAGTPERRRKADRRRKRTPKSDA